MNNKDTQLKQKQVESDTIKNSASSKPKPKTEPLQSIVQDPFGEEMVEGQIEYDILQESVRTVEDQSNTNKTKKAAPYKKELQVKEMTDDQLRKHIQKNGKKVYARTHPAIESEILARGLLAKDIPQNTIKKSSQVRIDIEENPIITQKRGLQDPELTYDHDFNQYMQKMEQYDLKEKLREKEKKEKQLIKAKQKLEQDQKIQEEVRKLVQQELQQVEKQKKEQKEKKQLVEQVNQGSIQNQQLAKTVEQTQQELQKEKQRSLTYQEQLNKKFNMDFKLQETSQALQSFPKFKYQ